MRMNIDELLIIINQKEDKSMEKERKNEEIVVECKEEQIGLISTLKMEGYLVVFIVVSDRFKLECL